jgi:GT2 family glycosyltransferase
MRPEVSIIIVNWNTEQLLNRCLQSVASARTRLALEAIVVDNGSADGSVEICHKLFPEVRLIENTTNMGFVQASNQGILASKARFVLLLNSDTILLFDSLEKMIKPMRSDPSIGIVGCRLIHPDGSYQPSCMNYPTLQRVFVARLLIYKFLPRLPRIAMEPPYILSQTECDWVVGACMLIRKRAIETAGLFDPNILMYSEEMELCYRIKAAGWRIVCEPNAKVVHVGGGSWKEKAYSPTFLKMRGLLLFFRKHSPTSSYYTVCVLTGVGAMLRVLFWSFIYLYRRNERGAVLLEIRSNMKILAQIMGNSLLDTDKGIGKKLKKYIAKRKE